MINILLVDDHELVRDGIKHMLTNVKGVNVIAEASDGKSALQILRTLPNEPDLIIMDIKMDGMSGLEVTHKILQRNPNIKILILTAYSDNSYFSRLLQMGVSGYLTKESGKDEMVQAISDIMKGKRYVGSKTAQRMVLQKPIDENDENIMDRLSNRELQILLMIGKGQKAPEIAKLLNLSSKTVNSYRYRIFKKLNLTSDVSLIKLLMKHKLIEN